jgi:hypothetical protein
MARIRDYTPPLVLGTLACPAVVALGGGRPVHGIAVK